MICQHLCNQDQSVTPFLDWRRVCLLEKSQQSVFFSSRLDPYIKHRGLQSRWMRSRTRRSSVPPPPPSSRGSKHIPLVRAQLKKMRDPFSDKWHLPFVRKFRRKFSVTWYSYFFGTENRNGLELCLNWRLALVIPTTVTENFGRFGDKGKKVIPRKVWYYFFSGKSPPRWTVPSEFSPEFSGFPYKWEALKVS